MGRKYQSQECGQKFTDKRSLTKHQKSAPMGIRYSCQECGQQFTTKCIFNKKVVDTKKNNY